MLWYFFGKRERVSASVGEQGVQEIKITVKGGYSPDVIVVREHAGEVQFLQRRNSVVQRAGHLQRFRNS